MKIGIYEQSGKLVKGDLEGYGELASSRHSAGSLCYINVTGKGEIILGSCIKVKKRGGREDRRMPICKTEMREIKRLASEFFKSCVDELEEEGYEIIGSIKEGDVQQLTKVEETEKQFDGLLGSAVGRVVFGEKVIVKSSNPVDSVSFIAGINRELESVLHLGFIFEISETPSTSDVNILPEVRRWDIDLDNSVGETGTYIDYYNAYKSIERHKKLESINSRAELKEEILSQRWEIDFSRAFREEDREKVKELYEERRIEFLEKLVGLSDTTDISWVVNEIGNYFSPPQINREVAAKLIEKTLSEVDAPGEKLLIDLYNQLRADVDFLLTDFLKRERVINKLGNARKSIKREIMMDIFKHGDDDFVRNVVMQIRFILLDTKAINRISRLDTRVEEYTDPESAATIICFIANNNIDEVDEYGDVFLTKVYKKIPRNTFFFKDVHSRIEYHNIISSKLLHLKFEIVNDAIQLGKLNREKLDALEFMKEYPTIRKEMESRPIKKQKPKEEKEIGFKEPTVGTWRKQEQEEKKRRRRTRIERVILLSAVVVLLACLACLLIFYLHPSLLYDKTPPVGIHDLTHTAGSFWINWTWINPADDFLNTEVYLNGTWKGYTSDPFFNATGLESNTTYEIGTHTVDKVGNINATWVNQTAKTKV
ncbi:MAG: hypothetical protein H8D26_06710 [Methanomicrobia archaeon]|nr:hypothetical protein [Methanomicrobia archaeon]